MAYLSRSDLEAIGARVAEAYQQLPGAAEAPFERVNIDHLIGSLLGLRIDYRHLSPDGGTLGLTSFCEIGIEVFSKGAVQFEDSFYMLDGKTILIEEDLAAEGANTEVSWHCSITDEEVV